MVFLQNLGEKDAKSLASHMNHPWLFQQLKLYLLWNQSFNSYLKDVEYGKEHTNKGNIPCNKGKAWASSMPCLFRKGTAKQVKCGTTWSIEDDVRGSEMDVQPYSQSFKKWKHRYFLVKIHGFGRGETFHQR